MTPNVSLAGIPPAPHSKTAMRTGAEAEPDDQGFTEVLNGKAAAKRQPPPAREEAAPDERPAWKLEAYAPQWGLAPEEPGDVAVADIFDVTPEAEQASVPKQETSVFIDDILQPPATQDLSGDALQAIAGNAEKAIEDTPPTVEDDQLLDTMARAAPTQPAADRAGMATLASGVATPQIGQSTPETGERRGRNAPGSTTSPAAESRQQALSAAASQSDKPVRVAPPPAPEAARFIPAREALAKGNEPSRSLPTAPAGDALAGRVNVLGFSAALAPSSAAMPLPGTTAAGVVAAMEADPTWRAAAMESAALAGQRAQTFSTGVNSLRIQLNPVELGMITARLSTSGQQLSVEIQVESNDARHKLANDSETILKALRGLGFDIDRITIQQSSQASPSSTQQGATGRDQFLPDPQAREEANGRGQSGERSKDTKDGDRTAHGAGEATAAHAGSSLYI